MKSCSFRYRRVLTAAVAGLCALSALAELQNVQIGGEIRIRGRYFRNTYVNPVGTKTLQIPDYYLQNRPIGPFGTETRYRFDQNGASRSYVEQKSKIEVSADFTDYVNAVIAVESYDQWGTDFRSDYVTGADFRAVSNNDVEITESFIDVSNFLGQPLVLRVGRQPINIDKRWLVADTVSATNSLSYDGIRLMYKGQQWELDGWATKLAETGANEEDGDVMFYGLHGTYNFSDALAIKLYWYLIRDGRSLNDTNFAAPIEKLEEVAGLDDYDPTYFHTVGTEIIGKSHNFDYDLELAYQFGEADAVGQGFKLAPSFYGDTGAEYDAWGTDAEVGYTFVDVPMKPRVFAGGAILSGEDNRDISFVEWLNPFDRPEASVSFNRMFSGVIYSWNLDVGQDLSNFKQVRAGIEADITDAIVAHFLVAKYWVDEPFDKPLTADFGRFNVPIAPAMSFLTSKASDDIGETALFWLRYDYSEDFFISTGIEYLFAGEALNDGNFLHRFGLEFTGGQANDDSQYFFVDMGLKFGAGGRGADLHQVEYRSKK